MKMKRICVLLVFVAVQYMAFCQIEVYDKIRKNYNYHWVLQSDMGKYGGIVYSAQLKEHGDEYDIYDSTGKLLYPASEGYGVHHACWQGRGVQTEALLYKRIKTDKIDGWTGYKCFYDINGNFICSGGYSLTNYEGYHSSYKVVFYTKECDGPCDVYDGNCSIVLSHSKGLTIVKWERRTRFGGDIFQDINGKWYSKNGELLFTHPGSLPKDEDILGKIGNNIYVITRSNGFVGVSTLDGKEILAPEFTKVEIIADKNFLYEMNGTQGVMTAAGRHIIPLSRGYTSISWSQTFKNYNFEKYGYKGTCNANGVQTSITKVAVPVQQQPSQPANNNRPQQHPTQGSQSDVKTPVYSPCVICGGTLRCSTCSGQGTNWVGSNKHKCGVCNGTGVCQSCHGTGTSGVIYQ